MKRFDLRALAALLLAGLAGAASAQPSLDVKGLDPKLGACTDFYRYANGKWLDGTEIPADRTFWGAASVLARANEDLLIKILDEASKKLPP